MRLASYVISLCIHAAIFLLVLYMPASTPKIPDNQPIMISLVEGAPGGNRTPSPILGHTGEESNGPLAPSAPAENSEIAAPEREPQKAPEPKQTAPQEVEKPVKIPPVPKQDIPKEPEKPKIEEQKKIEIPQKKEVKKPEPKKPETPKPEPKKEEPKKTEPPKPIKKTPPQKPAAKVDPVAAALQQARKATSRATSGDKGSAVEQALAQARKNAGGTSGGGGGEGEGPGGGGIMDVYTGQVMLAVRPNWSYTSSARRNLKCTVKVNVDMQGNVLSAEISQSSGNAQYDASAVNAIVRTGKAGAFPPPPNASCTDLDLVFTFDELSTRR